MIRLSLFDVIRDLDVTILRIKAGWLIPLRLDPFDVFPFLVWPGAKKLFRFPR